MLRNVNSYKGRLCAISLTYCPMGKARFYFRNFSYQACVRPNCRSHIHQFGKKGWNVASVATKSCGRRIFARNSF